MREKPQFSALSIFTNSKGGTMDYLTSHETILLTLVAGMAVGRMFDFGGLFDALGKAIDLTALSTQNTWRLLRVLVPQVLEMVYFVFGMCVAGLLVLGVLGIILLAGWEAGAFIVTQVIEHWQVLLALWGVYVMYKMTRRLIKRIPVSTLKVIAVIMAFCCFLAILFMLATLAGPSNDIAEALQLFAIVALFLAIITILYFVASKLARAIALIALALLVSIGLLTLVSLDLLAFTTFVWIALGVALIAILIALALLDLMRSIAGFLTAVLASFVAVTSCHNTQVAPKVAVPTVPQAPLPAVKPGREIILSRQARPDDGAIRITRGTPYALSLAESVKLAHSVNRKVLSYRFKDGRVIIIAPSLSDSETWVLYREGNGTYTWKIPHHE